jgi:nuclear pore complex protein Nup85
MSLLILSQRSNSSRSGISLRDEFILEYADYLLSDRSLWRVTAAYLYSCGEVGRMRGDEVLLRVPLKIHEQEQAADPDDGLVGNLKAIHEICLENSREPIRKTICRVCWNFWAFCKNLILFQIAAQNFLSEKDFGSAVAYFISGGYWPGIGRVVDCVLNEFIENGASGLSFIQFPPEERLLCRS